MKLLAILIFCLLLAPPAFSSEQLSTGCEMRIKQDLRRRGYLALVIRKADQKNRSCDGSGCVPDDRILEVDAETPSSERLLNLIVEYSGIAGELGWCRVLSIHVVQ